MYIYYYSKFMTSFSRINGGLTIVNETIIFDHSGNFKKKTINDTSEIIPSATDLSGISLWISNDGTFYKDTLDNFKFENGININGICASSGQVISSDKRLKTNIKSITNKDLENIMSLLPVSFKWKKDIKNNIHKHVFGFIAQDVQKLYPDLVYELNDMLHIDYIQLVPLLLKKIQYMSDDQNVQNNKLELLEHTINIIEKKLNS